MKLITAIVRPERLPDVEAALHRAGVSGLMLTRVQGRWDDRDALARARADTAPPELRDEIRVEAACADALVDACLDAIMDAARTGQPGDGRIFVQPLDQALRIRTGERDDTAVSPAPDDVERRARAQLQDTMSWNTAEQEP